MYFHISQQQAMYTCLQAVYAADAKLCFIVFLQYAIGICVVYAMWMHLPW